MTKIQARTIPKRVGAHSYERFRWRREAVSNSPDEMAKFERRMKRYWKGVPVIWLNGAEEYDGPVQIAWEAWIYRGLSDKAASHVDAKGETQ